MELLCSSRFIGQLDRYNGIESKVSRKIASIIRRYDANKENWHFELEKLKDDSFEGLNVFKIAVTAGDRLIFSWKGQRLTFLAIGKHEIMESYSKLNTEAIKNDLFRALKIPDWLQNQIELYLEDSKESASTEVEKRSQFLEPILGTTGIERWKYDEEVDKAWVTFLDDEQIAVSNSLFESVQSSGQVMQVHFILGGPGTGKTIVLFNLAQKMSRYGRAVSFNLSDPVLKYLKSSGLNVPGAQLPITTGCILLIDDPLSAKDISFQIRKAQTEKCKTVIIGLDPLQWHEEGAAQNFISLQERYQIQYHQLWTCYRQTRNVGQNALNLTKRIFDSKPNQKIVNRKIAEQVELRNFINLSLAMEFVDTEGRFNVVHTELRETLENEIHRFLARYDRWSHTSPIAFVFDDRIDSEIRKKIQEFGKGTSKRDYRLQHSSDLRGLEFQEVFVFISSELWELAQREISNLKPEEWTELSNLHTIFSRPKDSLILFIVGQKFV